MPDQDPALVTISREEYERLRAHAPATPAVPEQLSSAPEAIRACKRALEHALHVASYAVANLAPECNAGWPHWHLRGLADELAFLRNHVAPVDAQTRYDELAMIWRLFADEAGRAEEARQARQKAAGLTRAMGADWGPQTPEAAAVAADVEARARGTE